MRAIDWVIRTLATTSAFAGIAAGPASRPSLDKTVICFGDSITKIGFGDVLGDQLSARVINAGISGETTDRALKRLQHDVIDRKPDVVTLLYGTNDMVLDKPEPKVPLSKYAANLKTIIDRVKAAGARVVVCTVPPINATPYFKRHPKANYDKVGGLAKVIADYRAAAMRVADAENVPVVDLNTLLADQPNWMAADGVHPTPQGRVIIAKAIAPVVQDQLNASQKK